MSCSKIITFLIVIFKIVSSERTINSRVQSFQTACDQVYTQKQIVFESRNYPGNYPVNYQCEYLIKGPSCPTHFTIEFLDFNVEDSVGCTKDRLEVSNLDALCGIKSGVKSYYAEKGTLHLKFISDKNGTSRGYRILVTRLPCGITKLETTTEVPEWRTTSDEVEFAVTTPKYIPKVKSQCCRNFYDSKYFVLTSPNFPNSLNSANDCVYQIRKNNRDVCRLRIHVQFFYLGQQRDNCQEGFLEIDGKTICGCRSELRIVSQFGDNPVKTLRFYSRGNSQSYNGFVLEVIQDDCPKRYIPETTKVFNKTFRFYQDQTNRIAWPTTSVEKLKLIEEKTEIIDDDNAELNTKSSPKIYTHIYVYGPPNLNIPDFRDREETTYFDTSTTNFHDNSDLNYCINWNNYQFNIVSRMNLEKCTTQNTFTQNHCRDFQYLRGYLQTPGYPLYYPGNLNICYRLRKLPGYCAIRIYMHDFHIQNSPNCVNDYLSFGNTYRYCGDGITKSHGTIDLRNRDYEELRFVSDQYYCGRGFFATYEQIPCQEPIYPTPPPTIPPDVPTSVPDLPPKPRPISCDRQVQERLFTLEIFDYNTPTCTFVIRRSSPYICKIRLVFEKFDLMCAYESIIIDGRMYCGHLTGQSVVIEMNSDVSFIEYRKRSEYQLEGRRLRIRGEQIEQSCRFPDPEVPAERILKDKSDKQSTFMVKINKNFKDICGVVTNSTEIDLPETFCKLIEKNNLDGDNTKCLPLIGNSLTVPLNDMKIELPIKKTEKIEDIEFQVVDCDMLNMN